MHETLQPNQRAIPQDLTARRFDDTYVVAATSNEQRVEDAARALEVAGFSPDEIIVVSEVLDTVRITDDEVIETTDPVRVTRGTGRVAGGLTGAAFGAVTGLTALFVSSASTADFGLGVLAGGIAGACAGVLAGQWMASRLARMPAHVFEDMTREGAMLVGVGFEADAGDAQRERASTALRELGLSPRVLSSQSSRRAA